MSSSVVDVGVLVCHFGGGQVILLPVLNLLVYHFYGGWVVLLFVLEVLVHS
jgi:hypothetical protein